MAGEGRCAPQEWAQNCFFLCTLAVVAQCALIFLVSFLARVLSGLQASASGGWHVHTGLTCASMASLGAADSATGVGHYFDQSTFIDPWAVNGGVRYSTDAWGVASIDQPMNNFTLHGTQLPVAGRTVIIHLTSSIQKAGCGDTLLVKPILPPPPPSPPAPPPMPPLVPGPRGSVTVATAGQIRSAIAAV